MFICWVIFCSQFRLQWLLSPWRKSFQSTLKHKLNLNTLCTALSYSQDNLQINCFFSSSPSYQSSDQLYECTPGSVRGPLVSTLVGYEFSGCAKDNLLHTSPNSHWTRNSAARAIGMHRVLFFIICYTSNSMLTTTMLTCWWLAGMFTLFKTSKFSMLTWELFPNITNSEYSGG